MSPCTTTCVIKSLAAAFAVGFGVLMATLSYLVVTKPACVYPEKHMEELVRQCKIKAGDNSQGGKLIAIVTGSTAGIGEALVAELYRLGLHVIVASRNGDKCQKVISEIKAQYPDAKGSFDFGVLDIGDLDSVQKFCTWFKSKYTYLNFLVNNAGIHYMENGGLLDPNTKTVSKQGYDLVFATNYFGHFLLTHNLLPMIKEGRVINTASTYHFQSDASTLRITSDKGPAAANGHNATFTHKRAAYGVTKLTNVMHAIELQRRLQQENKHQQIQAISFCPGWVSTNMVPKGPIGQIIHHLAYTPRASILAPMGAIFDSSLKGGEFVSNVLPPIVYSWYGPFFMKAITALNIRDTMIDMLGFGMAFLEARSYGLHMNKSSEESRNEKISKELFEWSVKELKSKGYIQ